MPDDINNATPQHDPIQSLSDRSLLYSDESLLDLTDGLAHPSLKTPKKIRKRPWFSRPMNLFGRFGQAFVCTSAFFLGLVCGTWTMGVPLDGDVFVQMFRYRHLNRNQTLQVRQIRGQMAYGSNDRQFLYLDAKGFNQSKRWLSSQTFGVHFYDQDQNEVFQNQFECCEDGFSPKKPFRLKQWVQLSPEQMDEVYFYAMKRMDEGLENNLKSEGVEE